MEGYCFLRLSPLTNVKRLNFEVFFSCFGFEAILTTEIVIRAKSPIEKSNASMPPMMNMTVFKESFKSHLSEPLS